MGSMSQNATFMGKSYEVICSRSTDTYYISADGKTQAVSFEVMEILLELIGDTVGASADQVDMIKRITKRWQDKWGTP